jgi:hypothetical protein
LDSFRNAEILDKGDLDLAVPRGAAVRVFYQHCRDYDPITPIVSTEIGLISHGDNCQMLVPTGTLLPFPAKALGRISGDVSCFHVVFPLRALGLGWSLDRQVRPKVKSSAVSRSRA